jgi:hypothetical protein
VVVVVVVHSCLCDTTPPPAQPINHPTNNQTAAAGNGRTRLFKHLPNTDTTTTTVNNTITAGVVVVVYCWVDGWVGIWLLCRGLPSEKWRVVEVVVEIWWSEPGDTLCYHFPKNLSVSSANHQRQSPPLLDQSF